MPEYIEREALMYAIEKSCRDNPHRDPNVRRIHDHEHRHFLGLVENQPTADVVEVVRCKTCRHYDCENMTCMRMSVEPEAYGEGIYIKMQENDFCSYGKRKEE